MEKTEQIGRWMLRGLLITSVFVLFYACNPNERTPAIVELKDCPEFSADSAYGFIEKQLSFGPRVPETLGHQKCGDYIVQKLSAYGFRVLEQIDTVSGYGNRIYPLRNILGSINPQAKRRILLCAHWDSRQVADNDTANIQEPIDGANDNASGVAVLLELARTMQTDKPEIGVDLVFFDLEDQGRPSFEEADDPNDHGFCLGSKYWSQNLEGTKPEFGILLDMVGAKDAEFTFESLSIRYAEQYAFQIWDMANQLGYSKYFVPNRTQTVYDDHAYVNEIAEVPCIDIIQQDVTTKTLFWKDWHTHQDNIEVIDRNTLKAVGQTVAQVVYNQ